MPARTSLPAQAIAANCPTPENLRKLNICSVSTRSVFDIRRKAEMPDANKMRERLEKLAAICVAFPQVLREDQGSHASFRVGKKVFAYYLNDHHGDGIVSVCCKVLPGDNVRLIAANPRKFYMPAYIGPRGWVGLRIDRPTIDWAEVKELLHGSYGQTAPKTLVKLLEDL